jgi:hypothetical protein
MDPPATFASTYPRQVRGYLPSSSIFIFILLFLYSVFSSINRRKNKPSYPHYSPHNLLRSPNSRMLSPNSRFRHIAALPRCPCPRATYFSVIFIVLIFPVSFSFFFFFWDVRMLGLILFCIVFFCSGSSAL